MQEKEAISFDLLNELIRFAANEYPEADFLLPTTSQGLSGCCDSLHLCGNREVIQRRYLHRNPMTNATPEQRAAKVRWFIDKNFRAATNYELLKYGFTYVHGDKIIQHATVEPECCEQYVQSLYHVEVVDPAIATADLRSLRKAYGLTQVAFASHLGMPVKTYIKWEVNEHEVKPYIFEWLKMYCRHNPPEK